MKIKIFLLFLFLTNSLLSQEFSDSCIRNYTIYRDNIKIDNYKDVLSPWTKTTKICPTINRNLWADGEKLFKYRIENTEDQNKKEELIDSLMWIYDQRIKYFGDDERYSEGYILGKKAISLLRYRKDEIQLAYDILGKSIDLQKSKTNVPVLLTYMQTSRQLFINNIIADEQILSDYDKVIKIIDKRPKSENNIEARDKIEEYFIDSGAVDCDLLISLYSPKFDDMKGDSEWLRKVIKQLKDKGCSDEQLFLDATLKLFIIEPDVDAAHNIASMFLDKKEYQNAETYLEKSVSLCEDSIKLADMYYELALLNFIHFKKYKISRDYARTALEMRPNWGSPYILIGQIYIAAREEIFSNSFDQMTVFWVAVDQFIKARNIDPEVASKANELINQYSKHFPNNEIVFFHTDEDGNTLKEGDTYIVGGWINEKTTIRTVKL